MFGRRIRITDFALFLGWLIVAYVVGLTLFVKNNWRVDLEIMLRAADRLKQGLDPYVLTEILEHTKAPVITQFFIPLTWLPQKLLFVLWDLANVSLITAVTLFFANVFRTPSMKQSTAILICLILLLNPLNTEIWTGQFNVMIFASVLAAVMPWPASLRGVLLFAGLALKPSYLLFAPWIALHAPNRNRLAVATVASALASFALYAWIFGWGALKADQARWSEFLSLSTIKHLKESSNNGLPSWVYAHFENVLPVGPLGICRVFTIGGLAVSTLLAFANRTDKWVALCAIAVLVPLCSPMTWFQNYTLMIPFTLLLLHDATRLGPSKRRLAKLALVPLCLTYPFSNPEVMKTNWGHWYLADTRVSMWGAVCALAIWGIYSHLPSGLLSKSTEPPTPGEGR